MGRLSNPVQRRLSEVEVRTLTELYRSGLSIDVLAIRYRVHRTKVIHRLHAQEVPRRHIARRLSDDQLIKTGEFSTSGLSLAKGAANFGVHQATLTREFRAACVPIRRRRGWES